LGNFKAFCRAIEAQAVACRFPVVNDYSAMRGDRAARSGLDLVPSYSVYARFGTCRMLGCDGRLGRLGLVWLCADWPRAWARAMFLRVRTVKSAPLRSTPCSTPLLWAERRKPRVTSKTTSRLCLIAVRGGWPRAASFFATVR